MRHRVPILLRAGIALGVALGIVVQARAQGPLPDLDTLLERVRLADEQRARLLENAWGTCDVLTQTGKPACTVRESEAGRYLPVDEEALRWAPPRLHKFTWYRQGTHRRDDRGALRRAWDAGPDRSKPQPYCSVDLEQNRGYLNPAPISLFNLINLSYRFELEDLQRRPELDPLSLITRQLEKGRTPRISWSLIDETPCIQVAFEPSEAGVPTDSAKTWAEFHFAPGMNFALMRAIVVHESRGGSTFNIFRIAASYVPAPHAEEVWLCAAANLEFRQRLSISSDPVHRFERVQASFTYAELDSHLPEETFTFSGMGLSAEAPIYDLRLDGIRVEDSEAGFVVHPDGEYLFTGLSTPIPLETATVIVRDLRARFEGCGQIYIHAAVRDRVDPPTIHRKLYRRLAFQRLQRLKGDLISLLDYAWSVQDEVLVRILVTPHCESHHYNDPEPLKAVLELVERAVQEQPEALTPLHAEALYLATDLRKPGNGNEARVIPEGYDRAMGLLCACLERGRPAVQAAALRYLPGREVRTQVSFDAVKAALQRFVAAADGDAATVALAAEKLRSVQDFDVVR